MKKYKVLFCDLDGTLIDTITSKCDSCTNNTIICADIDCSKFVKSDFPKGIWDMKFKFDVLDAIKKLAPEYVFIVTNQGGIEKGFVDEENFIDKMKYINSAISEYTRIDKLLIGYTYCTSNDKDDKRRKPNTDMLSNCLACHTLLDIIPKENILMIGDASGLEGQFSDSDKKTAENFGIDYMDVNEFVKQMK